ncbi:MAG: YggT family protein [Georgfuchsia sp.]
MQILNFILQSVTGFFTFALLARFAMQWARAPFRNPIGQFVITVTDWMVRPARRVIPTAWGHDLPSLVLAWLMQSIYLGVIYGISGFFNTGLDHIAVLALLALIETASIACTLAIAVVIISALLSWINPHAPVAPVINAVAGPMLRPFQRFIPLIGGIDLSPIALFFVIKLIDTGLASLRIWILMS